MEPNDNKVCHKCGYTRQDTDEGPDYACPECRAVYAKVDAALGISNSSEAISPTTQEQPKLKQAKACPYCGEEILAVAIKCRYCGSDLTRSLGESLLQRSMAPKKSSWSLKNVILILFSIVIFSATYSTITKTVSKEGPSALPVAQQQIPSTQIYAPKQRTRPAPIRPAPLQTIQSATLLDAYLKNEIAADLKYKGRTLVISGKVGSRQKDILNNIYVTFESHQSFFSVQCFFADQYARQIANLKIGQFIRAKGKINGKMGNVSVKDCVLL